MEPDPENQKVALKLAMDVGDLEFDKVASARVINTESYDDEPRSANRSGHKKK